ncbi:MAG: hypothetical protein M1822_010247 [Bathelium mastoideum]|nr:MAG: hypothetical protein M1822_010247 [Bathelium mastoideum]
MAVAPSTAVGAASAVLALSKGAWKLGNSLSKLDQDTETVDTIVEDLAGETKLLGNECDLIYAALEKVVGKGEIGLPTSYDVNGRMWSCVATQAEEASRTVQDLELFATHVEGNEPNSTGRAQRQRKLDNGQNQIASFRTKVCWHTDNLHTTLLLINMVLARTTPYRANREFSKELDKFQDTARKLQRSSESNPSSRSFHTEATLVRYAREAIRKSATVYEASPAAESVTEGQGATSNNIRVAQWVRALESLRLDQRRSDSSDVASGVPLILSRDESHSVVTSATSSQFVEQEHDPVDEAEDDSDDDLNTDLAKAALSQGKKAFEAQEWEEAESFLQEAIQVLQQLPKQQRAFCDISAVQYKLAVCAYHTQEPAEAEKALVSLVQQSASSDEQRGHIYDAAHLLSHLYIRTGQVDRARSECEKALQGRRRLLGKRSEASLESTALMAHIYVLLNNGTRAKSYIAMIPEARRDAVLRIVEESLGTTVEQLDSSSSLTRSTFGDSDLALNHAQSRLFASSFGQPLENRCYGPEPAMISQRPATNLQQPTQWILSDRAGLEDLQSITVTSLSSVGEKSEPRVMQEGRVNENDSEGPGAPSVAARSWEPLEADEPSKGKTLSRKEIIDRIGCQPKDQIEHAVCDGDHLAFTSLLNRKKGFWRSKLRKRAGSERVTALHFAALFGEIDMACRLLGSSYSINEVPYGYTTSLTPLKFAIGARQVYMVEFLIANGAKPSAPDSWSTLAAQLMNRSWLMKTMSETEKDYISSRMIAILKILLNNGWDVNAPFEISGRTVLHQAVTFWTGSYRWDLNVRIAIASFLCERGADPSQTDTEGKTPYDMALTSGPQELLLALDRGSKKKTPDDGPAEPVELPGESSNIIQR